MAKTHPPYAPEFRRQMVELVRAGRDPADLAREFEPSSQAIHLVAWIGGAGALSPTRVPGYAMRTYSGRPKSSIRFSTSAAIATSLA